MKISASIYAKSNGNLVDLIKELDRFNIDYIHIDCNDNINIFEDIKLIRSISDTQIDLHIISPYPSKFYDSIIKHKIELVTFQYENLEEELVIPKDLNSKIGIALTTETNEYIFKKFEEMASFVLFMTTIPGKSGGNFEEKNFDKIRKFQKAFPTKNIHVDGGVNQEVSFILRNLGVNVAVSGNYLINSEHIGNSLLKLKTYDQNINYKVSDFMFKKNEIPIIQYETVSLRNILKTIEEYKFGFCLIERDEELYGIVTDGDIRRVLLNNINAFDKLLSDELINRQPIKVMNNLSVTDMLKFVNKANKTLTFLPVVNINNNICGVVSFQQLVKGES